MKRIRRIHIPIQQQIIKRFCGRKEVSCGVSIPACVRKKYPLPENRYEALCSDPTYDERAVQEACTTGNHWWPRTDAQGLQLESAAWQLLHFCHLHNCWNKLPLAWMSMLPPKGTLLRKKGNPPSVFIVLETCAHGVLRWPTRREYKEELQLELWQPSTTDDASSTWEPILDAAAWEIAFVHPVGPEFVEAVYGTGRWVSGAFRLFAKRIQVASTSSVL